MRAAGLLLPLLLLGVSCQDPVDPAGIPGQAQATTTKRTATTATPASTQTSSTISTSSSTTLLPTTTTPTTTMATDGAAQPTEGAASTAQSTTTKPGTPPSSPPGIPPTTVTGTTPTMTGTTSTATTTPPSHTSGQDSSSHGATTPKTTPAARSSASPQPSASTDTSGSLGTTAAAKSVVTSTSSPPGAVGAAGSSSSSTQPQGNQPLPATTVSSTVPRTDPSQSSKACVDSPSQRTTKQPPSSSSSPVQGPAPSTSPGSTNTPVTPVIGSPSLTTTPTSQPGSKDTVPKADTTTTPGADQSTHDVGSASAKTTSASQSPASAQPPAPDSGDHTDQTGGCSSGHQQPNISFPNELICEDHVQHTRPTIQLKEPRSCEDWRNASKNSSFFESFCSTAQHVFDASRDSCKVMLMACKPNSHHWALQVVLHIHLDSEEVLKELKEKKDRLEELGIVNITSDKMVEDMAITDEFSTPLIITIITLAGSLLLVAAIYGCHQRFSQKKDQNIHPDVPGFDDGHVALIFNQRLTEEMQTMENGYHDNPTLEVMETSSEMQEKKVNLNGELGDSWIVPLDTLMKEDLEEEEDTHL